MTAPFAFKVSIAEEMKPKVTKTRPGWMGA